MWVDTLMGEALCWLRTGCTTLRSCAVRCCMSCSTWCSLRRACAGHYIEEEVYHKTDDRKAAWHFFEPVTVELKGREETFLTNISVVEYTYGSERIFSLELTIEDPISDAEGRAAPASGRPAQHANGVSDVRVAAFQLFVKKEKTKIERNAREKGLMPWRVDEARLNELRGEAAKVQPSLPENIDLRDAKHTLATEDVWHMYRGHCLDSFLYDNQISITFDDIRMIPDIVENYDSVNFINSRKGYTLSFTKTYGDVVYQVTETIGGKEDNPRGTRQKMIFLTEITKNASGRALHPTSFSKNFTRTESVNPITNYIKQNYAKEAKKIAKQMRDDKDVRWRECGYYVLAEWPESIGASQYEAGI